MVIDSKAFARAPVLSQVRFAARAGEVLALLAPSGTGKTTALRIVVGLDRDFAGGVVRPAGRIGIVFQDPRLLPWLSVAANIGLVAPDLTRAAVDGLLASVGLHEQGDLLPKQISLGMARRAAIVRALAVGPSLLVLDEPFASLEPSLAARLAASVTRQARDRGAIVLVATHDLDQALAISDRVLVLGGSAPATLVEDIVASPAAAAEIRGRFAFLEGGRPHQEGWGGMSHSPQTPRRLFGLVLIMTGGLGGMAHLPQFFRLSWQGATKRLALVAMKN